ncbi:MAG: copper resistance protein CopC, partial [Chloroflexi bacterium]|nr:copper resistance protein CopC [Chloroflexota bacterium]
MLVLVIAAVLMAAAAPATPAQAHANLVRAEPPANSVLPEAPPTVQLWFSEEPEPRFSEVAVYTSTQERVPVAAIEVAPEDRRSLVVKLGALPPGSYTVAWKALSSVDGHTTAGAFAFAVGVGQTVAAPAGVAAAQGRTSQAGPVDVTLRWVTYLAMSALMGALAFRPLVLDRAPAGPLGGTFGEAVAALTAAALDRRLLLLAWSALGLTAASTLAAAVVQAGRAAGIPLAGALSLAADAPLPALLLATRYGQVWFGRLLLLSLLVFVLARLSGSRLDQVQRAK